MASLVCCKLSHWDLRGPVSLPRPPRAGAPSRFRCLRLPGFAGRITACFSESKPKPDRLSSCGYHPLEELTAREGSAEPREQSLELTNAEVARTVADVNWSAVVFATVSSQDTTILGTEVQYLIDENGDFYFEMDEEDHMLHNVGGSESHTVIIGIGNMDEIELADLIGAVAVEDQDEDDEDEEDSDLDEDVGEDWELVGSSDIEDLVQDWSSWGGDSSESPWPAGTSETMESVHPLEFGTKVAEVASADHHKAIDKPTRHLTITGAVRRVTKEEEKYVQKKWFDRFSQDGSDAENEDGDSSGSESSSDVESVPRDSVMESCSSPLADEDSLALDRLSGSNNESGTAVDRSNDVANVSGINVEASRLTEVSSSGTNGGTKNAAEAVEEEGWRLTQGGGKTLPAVDKGAKKKLQVLEGPTSKKPDDDPGQVSDTESCFYKLEIIRIQLDSTSGLQLPVDVKEFQEAKPDVLAHSAQSIIQRVNNGGQRTECALKALCKREKGLKVEEASLVGLDCLGVDLRIQTGIELKTLRFPFSKRAVSEEMAEVLLENMLFP